MPDDYQQKINKAKTLLNGTDAQRGRGIEQLKLVAQNANGTHWAEEAMSLIEKYDNPGKPFKPDGDAAAYLNRWSEINSFSDVRLLPFLSSLKKKPNIAMRLRTFMSKDIRKWIADAMPRISSMKAAELRAIERFVESISEIQAFNVEIDEIGKLRNVLFGVRYNEISQKIYNALDSWDMSKAWDLFEGLNHATEGFERKVEELRDEIYKVSDFENDVQAFLNQLSKHEPGTWPEARTLVDSLQKLQDYISHPKMPSERRSHLEKEADDCAGIAEAFLKRQATALASIEDLRAFWAEYERLNTAKTNGKLELHEEWFQTCLNFVISSESNIVVRAADPETLKMNGIKIMEDSQRLPAFAATLMQSLADEIAGMAANWKSMLGGNDFKDPSSHQGRLPIPELLYDESPKFRQFLNQLAEACADIKGGNGIPSEVAYEQALRVAQDVLSQIPQHWHAEELKRNAERNILHYQLDGALAVFDVENFLKLSKGNRVEGIYSYLADKPDRLRELAALATQKAFSKWREAADWWSQWRAAHKLLQRMVTEFFPEALEKAIRSQEELRTDQWYVVLDGLLKRELTPEDYVAAAGSLVEELESLNLQGYYNELMRKSKVGYVLRYITKKDFDKAREELSGLEKTHPDTIHLSIRLDVEWALDTNVMAISEVLRDKWSKVIAEYGDAVYGILLSTVEKAWQDEDAESLDRLRKAISRATSAPKSSSEDLEILRQWGTWLRLEEDIKSAATRLSIHQLISYLSEKASPGDRLRKWLERLVNHWQQQNDLKMMAWAYEAFSRVDPSLMPATHSPVEAMRKKSDQVADKALQSMQTRHDLQLVELHHLLQEIKYEENEWNHLNDFLSLLRPPAKPMEMSGKFKKTLGLIQNLISIQTTLNRLKDADLSEQSRRSELENIGWMLKRDFDGFSVQQDLMKGVEQLEYMTKLDPFEDHINKAAEKCGSDSLPDLYDMNCYPVLLKEIRALIEQFALAETEGGAMWQKLSQKYCKKVYDEVGILTPKLTPPDLRALADRIDSLRAEELIYVSAIEELEKEQPAVPVGGVFDPERHLEYLKLFPSKAPSAKRIAMRFQRFAVTKTMQTILRQSRPYLPDWVREYVNEVTP